MRIQNLEFKTNFGTGRDPEIVKNFDFASKESQYTILWWIKDKEGYDIHFLGSRPFSEDINGDILWKLMEYGQTVLDARFKVE